MSQPSKRQAGAEHSNVSIEDITRLCLTEEGRSAMVEVPVRMTALRAAILTAAAERIRMDIGTLIRPHISLACQAHVLEATR